MTQAVIHEGLAGHGETVDANTQSAFERITRAAGDIGSLTLDGQLEPGALEAFADEVLPNQAGNYPAFASNKKAQEGSPFGSKVPQL